MTERETRKIIAVMSATWVAAFSKMTASQIDNMVAVWNRQMAEYTYHQVSVGLDVFTATENKGFPPSPGQVIACIKQTEPPAITETAMEAWAKLRKGIRNSGYHAKEEFEKLSEISQRAIGSPETMRDLALGPSRNVDIEQNHFIRTYNELKDRKEAYDRLPANVKKLVEDPISRRIEQHKDVDPMTLIDAGEQEEHFLPPPKVDGLPENACNASDKAVELVNRIRKTLDDEGRKTS